MDGKNLGHVVQAAHEASAEGNGLRPELAALAIPWLAGPAQTLAQCFIDDVPELGPALPTLLLEEGRYIGVQRQGDSHAPGHTALDALMQALAARLPARS